ncbi:MAG: hypothetical protein AAB449_03090 [Patescibacteria group bacterium]
MNETRENFEELIVDPSLKEQLKKLVLERINVMPNTLRVAVGSEELTKEDMLRHVREEDETGKQLMEAELSFLRDLASGAVYVSA